MLYYWGYLRSIEHLYDINNSKYQGYYVIGSDHGRYDHKINNGIFLSLDLDSQENLFVDLNQSKILKKIYYDCLKEIKELKKEKKKMNELEILLIFSNSLKNEILTTNLKANGIPFAKLEDYILRITESERYISPISIDFFLKRGLMVCRHYSLAIGSMIEKAIEDELLKGKVSIDVNFLKTPNIKMGHAWTRYENDQKAYILDLAKNTQIISIKEYLKMENKFYRILRNAILYSDNLWDYKRPEESQEFKKYFNLKEDFRKRGYSILTRNQDPLNRLFLSPWLEYGIYLDSNFLSYQIYKFFKTKLNNNSSKKINLENLISEAYDYYNRQLEDMINLNPQKQRLISRYLKKQRKSIVTLSELVNERIIDYNISTLIFAVALNLAKNDPHLEHMFNGIISIERDDTSFERGKCFIKFKSNLNHKIYIVDFYHNYASTIPKQHNVSLWIYAENY